MNIAIIGIGSISGRYLANITQRFGDALHIVGVCDLIRERAEKGAKEHGIGRVYSDMYEAFDDPKVDAILNLTRPYQHYDVTKQALLRGKHVYSEKPLAAAFEQGRELAELAASKNLLLGGAPDTFLGAGIQTCARLIRDGFIGRPLSANAAFYGHGPDTWHPDPEFFYKFGGGPMMDMGPYYVTALVNLLGRVDTVTGMASKGFAKRRFTCKEHYGEETEVEVNTHVCGVLRFESGALATITASFDVYEAENDILTIYGEQGTLWVPDPNCFGGPVRLLRPEDGTVREMPLMYSNSDNSRGLGLVEMARAFHEGKRDFCTSSRQTYHVLDVLTAVDRSQNTGAPVKMAPPLQ